MSDVSRRYFLFGSLLAGMIPRRGFGSVPSLKFLGPYTEWMLLGSVAARVPGKLLWDPKKMEFTNNREANKYVRPVFRKGWELKSII